MRSTFYGFEIAKTGLFAAQRNIDLTGHNIANANTVGYTRQRLLMSSQELVSGGERFLEVTRGYSGAGVRTEGVEQIRNVFLDLQYRKEYSAQQMWSARSDALAYIEQIYNETGSAGLSASISSFFQGLHTLTTNPESKEYRTNALQNAIKLTEDFRHIAAQLADKRIEQNEAVRVDVVQINDIAKSIAGLNDQIFRFELSGQKANDLRDRRNNLLDALSGIVNITYAEDADGQVSVSLGGKLLVDRTAVTSLATTPDPGNDGMLAVSWSDTGAAYLPASGSLNAHLGMRDGNTASSVGIPYLMGRLDTLAAAIASGFNAVHRAGWTLPDASNGNVSVTGVSFFAEPAGGVTAANFSVDAAVLGNVYNIAASAAQITSSALRGDNGNALALVGLQDRIDLPVIGSIEGYLKGYIAEIGVEAHHSNQMLEGEQTLMASLANQRQSVSGVSVDEEMTNLVKFQHSYAASARVITAIDEYLDTMINRMGIVGR